MSEKHSNIKRIVHRCIEELKATNEIAKYTSIKDALLTLKAKLEIQKINRKGYVETDDFKKTILKKHDIMNEYFEKKFKAFINSYNFNENNLTKSTNYKNCIWVCWWQGINNAPEIVKKCVTSIKLNSNGHRVIVIDENNFNKYVNIPDWIIQKKEKGIMSRTHFSDFLRIELLAEHGGVWLDSTFFCVNLNIEQYLNLPIWSVKRPDYGHISVACGQFANYSFSCQFEERKVFAIIRDYLSEYWKTNNKIVDYLFLDYLIVLAQKHNKQIADLFNSIPANNPNCDELFKVLNEPFDCEKWECLKENTSLFKLTWKQEFKKEVNGQKTFYGKLVEDSLN